MIISFLGKTVKEYQKNYLILLDQITPICTKCHEKCHSHSRYDRKVRGPDATVIKILRVKCVHCKCTHAILPDFLFPKGRYSETTREEAIKETKKNVGTLKVTKKPDSDKHANPDESLDVFGPSLTGNQAPRFGPVQVAIFKSGYAVELSDLLATFGEAADYILPENFSPAHVSTYPVLIIPSAGLANQINSANFREKLTEYVEKGGNLIGK